jgi:hypothetical protein
MRGFAESARAVLKSGAFAPPLQVERSTPNCSPSPSTTSMVRFMTASPCFFHAHRFGKTFFIEQKAGIVAA